MKKYLFLLVLMFSLTTVTSAFADDVGDKPEITKCLGLDHQTAITVDVVTIKTKAEFQNADVPITIERIEGIETQIPETPTLMVWDTPDNDLSYLYKPLVSKQNVVANSFRKGKRKRLC